MAFKNGMNQKDAIIILKSALIEFALPLYTKELLCAIKKDDVKFAELLNRLSINSLTEDARKTIQQCQMKTNAGNYQFISPHLFVENYYMQGSMKQ